MTDQGPRPEPDVLAAYVDLQAKTPCRKCKGTAWTLGAATRWVKGGDRVGIFVVLGKSDERAIAVTFKCQGCQADFERPVYSREQLAQQQFPAVTLGSAEPEVDVKLDVRPGGTNGTSH